MLQDGAHILMKPLERMVSQQGNVDWFCFCEENPDPAEARQYARWHELHKLQEQSERNASPGYVH